MIELDNVAEYQFGKWWNKVGSNEYNGITINVIYIIKGLQTIEMKNQLP